MRSDRIVAAGTGAAGLIGLGLTLLPFVSLEISQRMLLRGAFWDALYLDVDPQWWSEMCEHDYTEYCPGRGGASAGLTVYDLIVSGYAVSALIPIALAVAAAVGGLYAWRASDPRAFTVVAILSTGALTVLAFTALNPSLSLSGTGDFNRVTSEASQQGDVTLSIGAGLYVPAAVLTVITVANAWQALTPYLPQRRPAPPYPAYV